MFRNIRIPKMRVPWGATLKFLLLVLIVGGFFAAASTSKMAGYDDGSRAAKNDAFRDTQVQVPANYYLDPAQAEKYSVTVGENGLGYAEMISIAGKGDTPYIWIENYDLNGVGPFAPAYEQPVRPGNGDMVLTSVSGTGCTLITLHLMGSETDDGANPFDLGSVTFCTPPNPNLITIPR